MSNDFQREDRYLVFKLSDIEKYLIPSERQALSFYSKVIDDCRKEDGKETLRTVCIEEDWPEYDKVWDMLKERMDNE